MKQRQFRSVVFRVHKWLGFNLCLLLAAVFASGTLLMFIPELNHLGRPDLWVKPAASNTSPVSTGAIYDTLLSEHPSGHMYLIEAQKRPWFGRAAVGSWGTAQVNAATGEIVGYGADSNLKKLIRSFHDSLLIPARPVRLALNFLSFVLIYMAISGLITYRRFWKGYFRFPSAGSDPRKRRGEWHRLLGVWAAPFLLASAIGSSVFFAVEVGWRPETPPPPPLPERGMPLPEGFDGTALDSILARCSDRAQGFHEDIVKFPDAPDQPLKVVGYETGVGGVFSGVQCFADPWTGKVTELIRLSDGNLMAPLNRVATIVHYGQWGGWFSTVLWVLGGLASTFLAFTGAQVYAARTSPPSGMVPQATTANGTISALVSGLGILKWGYLLLVLAMGLSTVVRVIL